MNEGKLPPAVLDRLLRHTAPAGPEVLVGAAAGEDAAVVRGGGRLVVTADPITFTEENIGYYAVAVNCNDVVAMGGSPRYLITTLLLPPRFPSSRLSAVFREIQSAAATAGVLWIGGHTEVTSAVTRVVISAQAIGLLRRSPLLTSAARPGQSLVMTKWAALEASTLIAREKPQEVRRLLGSVGYRQVLGWLRSPGIGILPEGRILERFRLAAGHDPTEGGIATGIHEIAARSGVGILLSDKAIPVHPHARAICRHFGIDPLGALSSGVFLFTAAPEEARRACAALARKSIPAAVIGEITPPSQKVRIRRAGALRPLKRFARDEVLKLHVAVSKK
jgi:hydrogenase expression/formation protein HypE